MEVRFGPYRLDPGKRVVWRGQELLSLPPRSVELLAALAARPGELVSKEELLCAVWPDTFVEEANLNVQVSLLRKALGGARDAYIETVSRRGYRFVAPVERVGGARRLAVLPFRVLGEAEDWQGQALADALTTRLAGRPGLQVRPTAVVAPLSRVDRPLAELFRELEVDALVTGQLQAQAGRLRASAQVVEGGTARAAGSVEASAAGLFALQDDIAGRLAAALGLGEEPPRRPQPAAPAYEAWLRGRVAWGRLTQPWLERAREAFELAAAADPTWAAPHASLATTHTLLALLEAAAPQDAWPRARAAAERALALDPRSAEACGARAYVRLFQDWDWDGAAADLEAARAAEPGSAEALQWSALFLAMRGRFEEAGTMLERARALEPASLAVHTGAGFHLYLTQQVQPDLAPFDRTLELDPEFAHAHWARGLALDALSRHAEATRAHRRASELAGGSALLESNLARSLALAGEVGEARALLARLTAQGLSPYRRATIELALGDREAALRSLEAAVPSRDHWLVWLGVDPMLAPLHGEPRLLAVCAAVGLG